MDRRRRVWRLPAGALVVLLMAGACGASGSDNGAAQEPVSTTGEQSTTSPAAGTGTTAPVTTSPVGTQASTTRPPASTGSSTTLGGPGFPPSTPPSQPVVTGPSAGAVATGLTALPGCENGRALVKLSWQPAGTNEQTVAVSARRDGLDTGNYTTSEILAANQSTYALRDSQPGGIYYWRVLTRRSGEWAASATAQFEGPTCVAF